MKSVLITTAPSLALVKYWGKTDKDKNLPATSSLAVTLNTLKTTTQLTLDNSDTVILDGVEQKPERFKSFFNYARLKIRQDLYFSCESTNNFPTAAGLASSSSGFAALALGINALSGSTLSQEQISDVARTGSASAARAVYGGFTVLPAGALYAEQIKPPDFWPELRVLVVTVSKKNKPVTSRMGMELSRTTSPFYKSWLKDSFFVFEEAKAALQNRDFTKLGSCMQRSYLRMFSTMFSADPPFIYWYPESIGLIRICAELRSQGIFAFETMDAGPQVKIFCLEHEINAIKREISNTFPNLEMLEDSVGAGPEIMEL